MSFVSIEAVVVEQGRTGKSQLWGVKIVWKEGDPAQLLQLLAARTLAQEAEQRAMKRSAPPCGRRLRTQNVKCAAVHNPGCARSGENPQAPPTKKAQPPRGWVLQAPGSMTSEI